MQLIQLKDRGWKGEILVRKHKKQKQLWGGFVNKAGAKMENQLLFWQLQPSVLWRKSEKWCQDLEIKYLRQTNFNIQCPWWGLLKNVNHNVWNKGMVLNPQMSLKCTIWKTESPSWSLQTWALGGKPVLRSWKIQPECICDASIPQPVAHPQSDNKHLLWALEQTWGPSLIWNSGTAPTIEGTSSNQVLPENSVTDSTKQNFNVICSQAKHLYLLRATVALSAFLLPRQLNS